MVNSPPTTGNAQLDRFLRSVADDLRTLAKPREGWRLSDFSADVSEVISDRRDLIDIVRAWGRIEDLEDSLAEELKKHLDLYDTSLSLNEDLGGLVGTFSEIQRWWDENPALYLEDRDKISNALSKAEAALSTSQSATSAATSAESKAGNAIDRVTALEAMGGLSPQSPVDGQTANLLTQSGSLTNAAVSSVAIPRVIAAEQETSTLGPELITSTGWSLGEGWSGNFADGFTKTPGGTGMLRWNPSFLTGTDVYLVEWKWEGTATHQDAYSGYDVYFGQGYAGITYQGAGTAATSYSRAIASAQDGYLAFIPWDTFEGRIHSVSVRKVDKAAPVGIGWRDSGGFRAGELRFGFSGSNSIHLGVDSGKWNYSGRRNTSIGAYSMAQNISGFYNTALGFASLQNNISGTRNVGLGYNTLSANTAGDRNVAIGPFALTRNTTGQRNVAVGTDVLWRNETGSDNVGIGYLTQTELRTGFSNVAIGKYAMRHTHGATYGGTKYNVAIGEEALGFVLGEGNIAIGMRTAAYHTGNNIVAIGREALEYNQLAGSQTAIGYRALRYNTGGRNTALGHAALAGVQGESTGERNVSVGDNSGLDVTSGSMNTIVGPSAGPGLSSGSRNVLLGYAAGGSLVKTGDDQLDIGNTLYGDLAQKKIGVGRAPHQIRGVLHLRASTGEPGDAPIKLDRGPLLASPETGALEFNSDKLYFTTTTGVRREIAFVPTA